MEVNKLHSLSPNEDITIINLRSKLLILENTYINQKMMNSYVFTYHGNQVQAIHRSMADMVSLSEALSSVGFRLSPQALLRPGSSCRLMAQCWCFRLFLCAALFAGFLTCPFILGR